ncbi:MAG: hypothetical protein J6R91_06665 [Bacteroidaceae bacterium]|nr:hypothetical protein [Bacteroidaceae bacterium]
MHKTIQEQMDKDEAHRGKGLNDNEVCAKHNAESMHNARQEPQPRICRRHARLAKTRLTKIS